MDTETRLNIVLFGESFVSLFPHSSPLNSANKQKALSFIDKIRANLGGTEFLSRILYPRNVSYYDLIR